MSRLRVCRLSLRIVCDLSTLSVAVVVTPPRPLAVSFVLRMEPRALHILLGDAATKTLSSVPPLPWIHNRRSLLSLVGDPQFGGHHEQSRYEQSYLWFGVSLYTGSWGMSPGIVCRVLNMCGLSCSRYFKLSYKWFVMPEILRMDP